jgi:PAS domain S-box-containing protein
MDQRPSYEELAKQHQELQRRVTRYLAMEQELINTRDQLDHELVIYKRLNDFNRQALKTEDAREFLQLVVESAVDIFETAFSFIRFTDRLGIDPEISAQEGIRKDQLNTVIQEISRVQQSEGINKQLGLITVLEPNQHDYTQLHTCVVSPPLLINNRFELTISSGILSEKAKLYGQLTLRDCTQFSVFFKQIEAFLSAILTAKENRQQMIQIAQSELELKKLSLIATKSKSGVIISDNQGRIEWVNSSFEQTTGYTLDEVIGKKPKDFLQQEPITNKDARQRLAEALRKKENVEVTILNVAKSGRPYFNQLEITPVFDEDGNHVNFIAVQRDITQEENYKSELMRINSRFELITDSAQIGIWEWYPLTKESVWNEVMYRLFEMDESVGNKSYEMFVDAIHPEDREKSLAESDQVVQGIIPQITHEYRVVLPKTKRIRYIRALVVSERDITGNIIRLVGSVTDVTDNRQYEATLIETNEELKKINRELDQFVYSVSHDLRSPLLSVKGLLTLIDTNLSNESLVRQYLGLIGTSINRLDGTIIEILDYSRNSRLDVQMDTFNVNEMIETIYQDLAHQVEDNFVFQLTIEGDPMVVTDRLRLSAMLKNVIANGMKYRKKRQEPSHLHILVKHTPDKLIIDVTDNGEGISVENQGKVFNMFYRASTSSSGTGLGLYICREMASKLGGEINLSSELGVGTTIQIYLPQHITT